MTLERMLPALLELAVLILFLAWIGPRVAGMVREWLAEPSYRRRVFTLTFVIVGFVLLETITQHFWPDSAH